MTGPHTIDNGTDRGRLATELTVRDRDVSHTSTADIDEQTAKHSVSTLLEDDLIIPVDGQRVLVHKPSGEAFNSITQLAVFHRGWAAARDDSRQEM